MEDNKTPTSYKLPQRLSNTALTHIEAALHLIPHIGGSLATYFGKIREQRVEERMLQYFHYFTERINAIDQAKLDHVYLKSEEFAELFAKGAEQASRSATHRKIYRFANILANNAVLSLTERDRTESIMSFVDRLTDLDSFVLLSFGDPNERSFRANTKAELSDSVQRLADFLHVSIPDPTKVIESVIYLDNLGLSWINEKVTDPSAEKGESLILKEFSSFRTPLGDAIVKVITPSGFFVPATARKQQPMWPTDFISPEFRHQNVF